MDGYSLYQDIIPSKLKRISRKDYRKVLALTGANKRSLIDVYCPECGRIVVNANYRRTFYGNRLCNLCQKQYMFGYNSPDNV